MLHYAVMHWSILVKMEAKDLVYQQIYISLLIYRPIFQKYKSPRKIKGECANMVKTLHKSLTGIKINWATNLPKDNIFRSNLLSSNIFCANLPRT